MKPVGTWAAFALTLTFAGTTLAQMAPAQAVPAQAAPVQTAPVQAVPDQAAPVQAAPVQTVPATAAPMQYAAQPQAAFCNPACAPNQVCASNGQCLQLVPVAPAYVDQTQPAFPTTRRNSTGMMVGGIVMAGVGGASALLGLMYIALADVGCTSTYDSSTGSYNDSSCADTSNGIRTMGTVLGVGGAIVAVAGIPLIIIGARKVPVNNVQSASAPTIRRHPGAEVVLLPQGLSLRGTF